MSQVSISKINLGYLPRILSIGAVLCVVTIVVCAFKAPEFLDDRISYQPPEDELLRTTECVDGSNMDPTTCPMADISSFAYHLFETVASSGKTSNVLLSPISIASALALVLTGATKNSPCQSQLQEALSVTSHAEVPNLASHLMYNTTNNASNGGVNLAMANGVWTTSTIREEYLTSVQQQHTATVGTLGKSYDPINKWISDATHGKIENLLAGDVDPLTVAVLVSAVYFKGSWKTQFKPKDTTEGTFYSINEKETKTIPFMNTKRRIPVGLNVNSLGESTIVQLEYENPDFVMLAMLPKDNTESSMQSLITNLAEPTISNILEGMYHEMVQLSFPRFQLSFGTASLKTYLQNLGIVDAFKGSNVFDVMSEDPKVHLEDVFHQAIMEVTEEGTVAAAATAGVMMTRSLPPPPLVVTFNRPFVVAIVHVPTQTPLFIGKVDDPVDVAART